MAARPGSENPLSGPRLPHSKNPPRQKVVAGVAPLFADPDLLADPAKGAAVARCGACGMPGPRLMVGLWAGLYGTFPLCEHCWFSRNPPDPLHVEAA